MLRFPRNYGYCEGDKIQLQTDKSESELMWAGRPLWGSSSGRYGAQPQHHTL